MGALFLASWPPVLPAMTFIYPGAFCYWQNLEVLDQVCYQTHFIVYSHPRLLVKSAQRHCVHQYFQPSQPLHFRLGVAI